jgi:hypothetical protein
MDRDNSGGAPPSDFGERGQVAGNTLKEKPTTTHGLYDEFLGQSPSALVSAKDAVVSHPEAASSIDLSGVRDEIAKLTQTVTHLVQKQASMEQDMGSRIRKNPWIAVSVAALVGVVVAKMT